MTNNNSEILHEAKTDRRTSMAHWARTVIGRTLTDVLGRCHLHLAEESIDRIIDITLVFDGMAKPHGYIKCGADGESLEWCQDELRDIDLGEFGKQVVVSISDEQIWRKCVGHSVVDVHVAKSGFELFFAVQLIFSNKAIVWIANLGDELMVTHDLAQEVLEGENAVILSLNRDI